MSLLRRLPGGVHCSFVFHRIGAENTASQYAQTVMQALDAPVEQTHWQTIMEQESPDAPYYSPEVSALPHGESSQGESWMTPETPLQSQKSRYGPTPGSTPGPGIIERAYDTWMDNRNVSGSAPSIDRRLSGDDHVSEEGGPSHGIEGTAATAMEENSSAVLTEDENDEYDSANESPTQQPSPAVEEAKAAAQMRLAARTADLAWHKVRIMNGDGVTEGSPEKSAGENREPEGGLLGTRIAADIRKPFGIRFFPSNSGRTLIVDDVQGVRALEAGIDQGDILESLNGEDVTRLKSSAVLKQLKALADHAVVAMIFRRPGIGGTPVKPRTPPKMSQKERRNIEYPVRCGWLEKKGTLFWNMRYVILEEHSLAYYSEEIKPGLHATPRGVLPLDGATFSLDNEVLSIQVRTNKVGMNVLDRARHGSPSGMVRLWHRDPSMMILWFEALKLSQEAHSQRALLKEVRSLPSPTSKSPAVTRSPRDARPLHSSRTLS